MKPILAIARWHLRSAAWVNVLAVMMATLFLAFTPMHIDFFRQPYALFPLFHLIPFSIYWGRSAPGGPAFLYAQGYTRDQIWWGTYLATLLSGLTVCTAVWLVLGCGVRVWIQSQYGNPWFPSVGTVEAAMVKWVFLEYFILASVLHYAWIRARQPNRDAPAGFMLVAAFVVLLGQESACVANLPGTVQGTLIVMNIVLAILILLASWRFHRTSEVQG